MGLHRFKPMPSGRMGIFWTLSGIKNAAVIEFGCMGHNIYSGGSLRTAGVYEEKGARLYTTYIDETDIAMGDTRRLEQTIRHVISTDNPEVIFLQPSAVPEVVGMDLVAIAKVLQEDFSVPLVPIGRASFAMTQHKGVQEALRDIVKAIPMDAAKSEVPCYNIVGSCADLFNFGADALEIQRLMAGAFGMQSRCVLSHDCTVADIQAMGCAHVNLVFRREGIPAAQVLQKRFGTPYVLGRPYGVKATTDWLRQVGKALGMQPDSEFIRKEETVCNDMLDRPWHTLHSLQWSYPEDASLSIGGHADVVSGILKFATEEMPLRKGVCWCDNPEHESELIPYFSESDWASVVQNHEKGFLMASGEALLWAGKNTSLQVANPDIGHRLHPWGAPFVGYHGAVHLVNLWLNEYVLTH